MALRSNPAGWICLYCVRINSDWKDYCARCYTKKRALDVSAIPARA